MQTSELKKANDYFIDQINQSYIAPNDMKTAIQILEREVRNKVELQAETTQMTTFEKQRSVQ